MVDSALRARFESAAPLPPGLPSTSDALVADPGADAGEPNAAAADRLDSWARLTEQSVLLPGPGTNAGEAGADLRARFGSPGTTQAGQVGRRLRWGGERLVEGASRDAVWEYPDLGVRMAILDRLLVFRPDLSDSKVRDSVTLPSSALLAMYARVLAALGGAQHVEGDGAAGSRAASTK